MTRPSGSDASWKTALEQVARVQSAHQPAASASRTPSLPADRRIVYLVHLATPTGTPGVQLSVATQRRNRDGMWDEAQPFAFSADAWTNAPDVADRLIANLLLGTSPAANVTGMPATGFVIPPRAYEPTLRLICETGRALVKSQRPSLDKRQLQWDDGAPYTLHVEVVSGTDGSYKLTGALAREGSDTHLPIHDVDFLVGNDLLLTGRTLTRVELGALQPLAAALWRDGELDIGDDLTDFLEQYHATPGLPPLSLPDGALHTETDVPPVPYIVTQADVGGLRNPLTWLAVRFRYGSSFVEAGTESPWLFDRANGTLYRRRLSAERNAVLRLRALGAQEHYSASINRMRLALPSHVLLRTLSTLVQDGWQVQHEGRAVVSAGPLDVRAQSGIDWFDITGAVTYGEHRVPLFEVLQKRAAGEDVIELPDGSMGLMPRASLAEWQAMLQLGERHGDTVRFGRGQLALIDVLLDSLPDPDVDAQLEHARAQLRDFRSVGEVPVPAGFVGELRGYQHEALGWFAFLRQFGLGGCLADDMGLGKTVQVLALLEARRAEGRGPSLLVVPRSLVFNWVQEAARFTPQLRVLDLSMPDRADVPITDIDANLVITTYGTLRRDVLSLGQRRFDYIVLDEAQAIKNAGTATAKAARLLQGDHKLALSGTPIENRIEELWSLFEFLNPGMLGASTRFSRAARMLGDVAREAGDSRPDDVLARALRPVILRRTKAQVASELPPRVEQTLEVELEPKQRAFYDELRVQQAENLFALLDKTGMARSRMQILEALLRLRQAACHPVLADPRRAGLPSAKLDALIPALQEVTAEGHKALVFSQFTSFLALVKDRLDAVGLKYEYLDGRTKDRGARVARFQSPEGPPVFLISLKAGGHGLNLTAAEYVYLLDPWWNPAVEAQAIDRAHRIGQTRHVLATRVVARDTIESKILELQASKRALADAILSEDKGGLGTIGRAELELLLG